MLPPASDWPKVRPDGSIAVDVRVTLKTDDGALIYTAYYGRIAAPPEILSQLLDLSVAPKVDPSQYYFRVLPLFETASEKYAWLNKIVSIGVGRFIEGGLKYKFYEVK